MNSAKTSLKKQFGATIYKRGLDYFLRGYVNRGDDGEAFQKTVYRGAPCFEASVSGTEDYVVRIKSRYMNHLETILKGATCNCQYFKQHQSGCKHIVAALLEWQEGLETFDYNTDVDTETNHEGSKMLTCFSRLDPSLETVPESISLKIRIMGHHHSYPTFSFQVGREKYYVIKRLDEFLVCVHNRSTHSYGKNLSFSHGIENFDLQSQDLIKILDGQNNQATQYGGRSREQFTSSFRCLFTDHNSFQKIFALYQGESIEIDDWHSPSVILEEGDPSLSFRITRKGEGAIVTVTHEEELSFFGNEFIFYVLTGSSLFRCSREYSRNIFHLALFYQKRIYVSPQDLPTLCSSVIGKIRDYVEIDDPDNICEEYLPDECLACFYFDYSQGVTAELKFQYGDILIPLNPSKKQLEQIRRNQQQEERAIFLLEQQFSKNEDGRKKIFDLMGDEEEFLTEKMDSFREYGEVFLSGAIRRLFIEEKSKPMLGISVSDGLLELTLDTGEFPAEELEELYSSFLRKRKFHKLRDGRYLRMDGTGVEKMAEISHMLQLSPKELAQKNITLPAYRGLYLDSVLENVDEVKSTRNLTFRRMMKDFKAVGDSDFQPSEDLREGLRPYQVLGFQWMKTLEQYGFGGILADEMGLGKTVQVITYLLSLKEEKKKEPSLVICPASLLFNWQDELQRFAPSLQIMMILGTAKERKEQILTTEGQKVDVWVTSYDLIKRDREHYEKKKFYACILDEGQNIKNQSTLASKTVKNVNSKQRFVLTGTPIENRLSELWNLFDFLMPGYLFTHNAFVSNLEKPMLVSGDTTAGKQLSLLVQPFIMRRLKKDVLKELPDKLEYVRKIHLSEKERKIYLAAMERVKVEASETQNKLQILALLTHLRQLCCDPSLCFEDYDGESSKLEACIELCQSMVSNGHRILLFSQFTTMLDIIREKLSMEGIRHLTIEGSTPKEKRAKYVKEFQNGQADVFLISLKAGGTGLNLTEADVVIHYDPWWNQAAQNQATDRAHRFGQKEHVQVYKLIAQGTIEEKILELQEKKASLMEAVMAESGDEPLSREDIMALLD